MDMYQWSGEIKKMIDVYEASSQLKTSDGDRRLRWTNPMMHPPITFRDVRDMPVWTRTDAQSVARIMDILEENVDVFKSDLQALKAGSHFGRAYDYLQGGGTWAKVTLYSDGLWREDICAVTPKTCALFRREMPGEKDKIPLAVHNQEEVVLFYSAPNSRVLPHSGAQNGRVNIHIGLEGYEGSRLNVYTNVTASGGLEIQTLAWSDTKAVAFNDGWQHEIINGPEHRFVLAVGIVHPDIRLWHFAEAFNSRTSAMEFSPHQMETFRTLYQAEVAMRSEGRPIMSERTEL